MRGETSSWTSERWSQRKLKTLGHYDGQIDGDFGPGTEAAVRAVQDAQGLVVDGIAGPNTLKALEAAAASAPPEPPAAPPPQAPAAVFRNGSGGGEVRNSFSE